MASMGYYAGGARVVVEGVPCRWARKPSKTNLDGLRESLKDMAKGHAKDFGTPQQRAAERAKQAKRTIEIYAAALGISYRLAQKRIAAQIEANAAFPGFVQIEYDL